MTFQMALRYYSTRCSEHTAVCHTETECTYVSLDVEVLKVEGVFPNIDANDGDVRQERVLVGSGRDLDNLGRRVVAL